MANDQVSGAIASMAASIRSGRYPWWYPDAAKTLAIDIFTYGTNWAPLGVSATVQNNINIDGGSAFVMVAATLVETDVTDLIFLAANPVLFRIRDTTSGRDLSNIAIHANNWFGTAQEPYFFPVPRIWAPQSTLAVEAQNLEATARNIRIAFHGFKIFNFRP